MRATSHVAPSPPAAAGVAPPPFHFAPVQVRIRDRKLGVTSFVITVIILAYIVGYQIIYQQTYRQASSHVSNVGLFSARPEMKYRWPDLRAPYCAGTHAGNYNTTFFDAATAALYTFGPAAGVTGTAASSSSSSSSSSSGGTGTSSTNSSNSSSSR